MISKRSVKEKKKRKKGNKDEMRKGGLEPPRLSVPGPKPGASANSATFAKIQKS